MKATINFFIFFILILSIPVNCNRSNPDGKTEQQNLYSVNTKNPKNPNETLRVRDTADLAGKQIYSLPNKSTVNVIETDETQIIIDGITGNWVLIEYENITGWVFNGYLEKINNTIISEKNTIPENKPEKKEAPVAVAKNENYFEITGIEIDPIITFGGYIFSCSGFFHV